METTQPLQPPQPPPPKGNNRRTIIVVLAVIIALLAAGLIYTFTQKEEIEDEKAKIELDKNNLQTELKQLDHKMEEMDLALRDEKLDNKRKREMIKKLNDEITYLKVRLHKALNEGALNKKLKEEYQGKYKQLAYYNKRYRDKITELEKRILEQEGKITELTEDLDSLEDVSFRKDGEIGLMSVKVKVGQMLKATNPRCFGINSRGKEFEGPEIRQRKIRSFKGCINLVKNEIALSGKKTLYLVLTGPNGKAYHTPATGSGYFSTEKDEQAYTARQDFDYNGESQTVCVTYNLPETLEFDKGETKVEWLIAHDETPKQFYQLSTTTVVVK